MQTQFQYIVDLAKRFQGYSDQPESLYKAINELPPTTLEEIFKEYGDPENRLQPVNLLRAAVAKELLEGKTISEKSVDEIKDRIRKKDKTYFNYFTKEQLKELEDYPEGKRDIFGHWQKPWSVFHTCFFTGRNGVRKRKRLKPISSKLLPI